MKVKLTVEEDGVDKEIEVEESELPENFEECTPGEESCINHIKYKCSKNKKLVKIGSC